LTTMCKISVGHRRDGLTCRNVLDHFIGLQTIGTPSMMIVENRFSSAIMKLGNEAKGVEDKANGQGFFSWRPPLHQFHTSLVPSLGQQAFLLFMVVAKYLTAEILRFSQCKHLPPSRCINIGDLVDHLRSQLAWFSFVFLWCLVISRYATKNGRSWELGELVSQQPGRISPTN
jgi:hypothetical protein